MIINVIQNEAKRSEVYSMNLIPFLHNFFIHKIWHFNYYPHFCAEISVVMKTAPYYLLSNQRAEEIKEEVTKAVSSWRKLATQYKISPLEIERKAKAFRI